MLHPNRACKDRFDSLAQNAKKTETISMLFLGGAEQSGCGLKGPTICADRPIDRSAQIVGPFRPHPDCSAPPRKSIEIVSVFFAFCAKESNLSLQARFGCSIGIAYSSY